MTAHTAAQHGLAVPPVVAAVVASVAPVAITQSQNAASPSGQAARAKRAETLMVKPVTSVPSLYHVTGGEQPHIVNLDPRTDTPCDCMDARIRRAVCKHQHAVGVFLTGRAS
jgi:hypothetical protein